MRYSTNPVIPLGASENSMARSNFASWLESLRNVRVTPGTKVAGIGSLWTRKLTWNSGIRARLGRRLDGGDELLERQILVRVGAQRDLAHPRQHLLERRRVRHARAEAPGCC